MLAIAVLIQEDQARDRAALAIIGGSETDTGGQSFGRQGLPWNNPEDRY
jgi:hypothetical protein